MKQQQQHEATVLDLLNAVAAGAGSDDAAMALQNAIRDMVVRLRAAERREVADESVIQAMQVDAAYLQQQLDEAQAAVRRVRGMAIDNAAKWQSIRASKVTGLDAETIRLALDVMNGRERVGRDAFKEFVAALAQVAHDAEIRREKAAYGYPVDDEEAGA